MRDDVRLVVTDRVDERKKAEERIRRRLFRGQMPQFEDVVKARGLVLRERQDSAVSDAWLPFATAFLLVGFLADRNQALMGLGAILLLTYLVSAWWKDNALVGVSYRREFDRTRVFPGEEVQMTLHFANMKPLPLTWLRFNDRLPVAPLEGGVHKEIAGETRGAVMLENSLSIGGRSRTDRSFTIRFPRRGHFFIGPVTYHSGDIFTLFTVERKHDYVDRIVVYPQTWSLQKLGLPAKEPFGELAARRSLFTDPIRAQGIRDYSTRDRFRDIHWKASARRGELQTKVYEPSVGMTLVVFLNVATMRHHWMGFHPEQLERAISVAASVAAYGVEQKWAVGLHVNSSVPKSDQPIRVPAGRSPDQLSHILEALAATTEFAAGSVEKLMIRESPRLSWSATLALITAHVSDEMGAVLMRLKEAGRRVVLISLAEEMPPSLQGLLVYHVPPDAPAFETVEGYGSARDMTVASLSGVPVPVPVHTPNSTDGGRNGGDD